jgi:hypothetical protein
LRETDSGRAGSSIRLTPDSTQEPETAPLAPAAEPVYVAPARRAYDEPAQIADDQQSVRMTYAEPAEPLLFGASPEPALFASAIEQPRRRSGLGIWFAAAASLVLGIVIGFASGFSAGRGSLDAPSAADAPAPTSGSASPGQPFSESTVPEPVRVDPQEVIPTPAPGPSPASPPAGRTLSGPPAGSDKARVPIAPEKPRPPIAQEKPRPALTPAVEETPRSPTGPGALQVLSRPAGAEVIIDGKSVGRTPLSMEMSPGSHDVRLSLPGFKGWATTVDVKAGGTTRVSGSLEQ